MLVKRVSLSTCVRESRRWHEQKHHFPNYPGCQQPDKQTRKTYTWRYVAKRSSFLSSRVSWRPSQTVGDRTLLQIWRPPTTLSIRYTASSSDRLAVLAVDSINSTCTYYNTVNKRILITANKRIHIISAYFLAAASDKRMRLLTSLYGIILYYKSWPNVHSLTLSTELFQTFKLVRFLYNLLGECSTLT